MPVARHQQLRPRSQGLRARLHQVPVNSAAPRATPVDRRVRWQFALRSADYFVAGRKMMAKSQCAARHFWSIAEDYEFEGKAQVA